MAYPISTDVLNLFVSQQRQVADITFYGTTATSKLSEKDICQGGLSIDRYCISGSRLEIGSAVAAELTLKLDNRDGRFNSTVFEGAELLVRIGTKKWEARNWENATEHYIPMGYFTIDNSPRRLTSISITALDRMVNFDKAIDRELLSFPMTIGTLLTQICDICNVEIATTVSSLLNYDYSVGECPTDENLTYRQLLQWIAEITCTCAYIDWDGKLRLEWYKTESSVTIKPSQRFSSDLNEKVITITGVKITDNDKNEYLSGDDGYAFNIESNSLIQSDYESIADSIYAVAGGFTYTPFSCTAKPFIHLYPLDKVVYEDKDGTEISSVVTNVTFTMNGNVSVSGQGETETSEGYASANPLTKQQSVIINTIKGIVNEQLNERVQSVISLNEAIAGALGLYKTEIANSDGSFSYYVHTNPVLVDSKDGDVIYTLVGGGFACCTTGWNGGNPVWQTGFTKDGNAVYKFISANGIEVSDANVDYSTKITPEAFEILYRGFNIISANADESTFTKVKIQTHADCGKVRIVPHTKNGVMTGTNIVFLD